MPAKSDGKRWLAWAMSYALLFPTIVTLILNNSHAARVAKAAWSQEAAGWAQAIFSVVAIIGAVSVGLRQMRHERELDRQRRQEQIDDDAAAARELTKNRALFTVQVLHHAAVMIASRLRTRGNPAIFAAEGKELRQLRTRSVIASLDQIDVNTVPLPMIAFFISMRSNLTAIVNTLDEVPMNPDRQTMAALQKVWDWAQGNYADIRMIAINACGVSPGEMSLGDWRNFVAFTAPTLDQVTPPEVAAALEQAARHAASDEVSSS